jgi:hypothetical protein
MNDQTISTSLTNGFHLVVDALKLNGIDTIYGVVGIPITDLARLAQAEGIRLSDAETGHLPHRLCSRVSQRNGGPGGRHHEWVSHDPDQRIERAGDRRPSARRV